MRPNCGVVNSRVPWAYTSSLIVAQNPLITHLPRVKMFSSRSLVYWRLRQ